MLVASAMGCGKLEAPPVEVHADAEVVVTDTEPAVDANVADAEAGADAIAEVFGETGGDADAVSDAGAAEADAGAIPSVVATGVLGPRGIAVGDGYAWVTSFGAPGIYRVPVTGGATVKVASAVWPTYVATDATHVYWTDLAKPGAPGSVGRVPIAGGPEQILASGLAAPSSCALFGGDVYVAEAFGRILAVPKAGGATATLASGGGHYAAANTTGVCWASDTAIRCVPHGGGVPTTLVDSEPLRVAALALDETRAFWVLRDGRVRTAAFADRLSSTLADAVPGSILAPDIALDGAHLYVVSGTTLRKIAKSGGVTPLASDPDQIWGVAVDATHVYWTAGSAVRRIAK